MKPKVKTDYIVAPPIEYLRVTTYKGDSIVKNTFILALNKEEILELREALNKLEI